MREVFNRLAYFSHNGEEKENTFMKHGIQDHHDLIFGHVLAGKFKETESAYSAADELTLGFLKREYHIDGNLLWAKFVNREYSGLSENGYSAFERLAKAVEKVNSF